MFENLMEQYMLFSKWKNQAFLLTAICCLPYTDCSAAWQSANTKAEERPQDFTKVAKEAIPAVVSIKVEAKKKSRTKSKSIKRSPWGQYEDEDSINEFWERFFGLPYDDKEYSEPSVGQASGFLVSPDGYVLTNNHVVDGFDEIKITLNDGREFQGKVIGKDNNTDIALVKIDSKDLPYIKLGNSDNLEVAQPIMAIGTPFGLQASVTVGVVSAKNRNNLDIARIEDFIQTDAAINRGNSGGPLLNINGEVVGVNTAIASNMGGYMGIGFAVPSNIAKNVMDQLISKGSVSRSYIGVELQQIDNNLAQAFRLPKTEGALVAQVVKGSPAEKANIKQGDVIVKYNDLPVTSIGGFRTAIALMPPGTKLKLSLLRDGKPLDISLDTGDFSASTHAEKIPESFSGLEESLGIAVANLTPENAQKLGYRDDSGVIVTRVEHGSIAHLAGLRKGSLILGVNRKKINSVEQFKKEFQEADKSMPILLLVKDGQATRYISFKLG